MINLVFEMTVFCKSKKSITNTSTCVEKKLFNQFINRIHNLEATNICLPNAEKSPKI